MLMKQRRFLLRACDILFQKILRTDFKREKLSSVCSVSAPKAGDIPGLSSPVLIAGDFGGVSSFSDLVTTAACRGDKSHSDAVL